MTDINKWYAWEELIRRIAKMIANDFPGTEEEDLIQELALFVLQTDRLKDPDDPGMTTALLWKAKEYAWNVRKQSLHLSAQYAYRVSDIRRILEDLFYDSCSQITYLPDDQKTFYHDDRLAANSDIRFAYSRLSEDNRRVIFRAYALRDDLNQADKRRQYRAIRKMADILNFYQKGGTRGRPKVVGRRTVLTNEEARWAVRYQDEGDVSY